MVSFVLHTHLPYVLHHGTWPHGSDWLCEAVAECYLPLLSMCKRLHEEGIRPGLTFDISPVLCEQLAHPHFPDLFRDYCTNHIALAKSDVSFLKKDNLKNLGALPKFWKQWYGKRLEEFDALDGDILGEFKQLQEEGAIELMTCGLTHGYFPLLAEDSSIDLQIKLAVECHTKHFGTAPRGIWLPECAYRPSYSWKSYLPVAPYAVERQRAGVEELLRSHGLEFFVTDQGALEGGFTVSGNTASVFEIYNIGHLTEAAPVSALSRHRDVAMMVWSGDSGYPGDPDYLDFHKKYYKSALRYWRVTDNQADMQHKQEYVPEWAHNRALVHAEHYAQTIRATLEHATNMSSTPKTLCLPFDTELFGHWWFEGPLFLEHVIRHLNTDHAPIAATATAYERVKVHSNKGHLYLPESSWGRNGNHDVWMNADVQWTWEKEYRLEYRLRMLLEKHNSVEWDSTMRRIMKNGIRQLLLAQASDWQFLISTFSSREYAEMRFHNHAEDAQRCFDWAEKYLVTDVVTDEALQELQIMEDRDGIFEQELSRLLVNSEVQ